VDLEKVMVKETVDVKREDVKDFILDLYNLLFKYDDKLTSGIIVSELEVAKWRYFSLRSNETFMETIKEEISKQLEEINSD
jgi:hypothetical protein